MKENIEEDMKRLEKISECFNYSMWEEDTNALKHILSDYKRVLKENEELKETNKVISIELTKDKILQQDCLRTVCGVPIGEIPKIIRENEELKKFITKGITIEPNNPYKNYRLDFLRENFIPVQKIKDKIEEVKEEYKTELEKNSTRAFILKCQITILEDLLEEKGE